MSWRVAKSLNVLKAELDTKAPNRSQASDGSIGDAAHASRDSDHNPWVVRDGVGIVRARDFTHDPAGGLDCNDLARDIAAMLGKHLALGPDAYIIWNSRIISANRLDEGWRPYSGSNPHDKHLHLSVTTDPSGFDSLAPWFPEPLPRRIVRPKREKAVLRALRALRDQARKVGRKGRADKAQDQIDDFKSEFPR